MPTVIIFLIIIVFLVVAHELGHFLVAKAFGIRVDEFGIGYPPRAKKLFSWKGTLFTLNWLPFGGFVKIFGEDAPGGDTAGSFAYQKMWKRVLVLAAGIIANVMLAIVLYSLSFGIGFLGSPEDFHGSVPLGPKQALVTGLLPGGPASKAGIKAGDIVTELSTPLERDNPTSVAEVVNFVQKHAAEEISVTVQRGGAAKTIMVTPKAGLVEGKSGIGISLAEASRIRLPFFRAIGAGVAYTFLQFGSIIASLGALVLSAFHGSGELLSQVSGPVGIAQVAGQASALGLGSLLGFVALISVNLAVINLLPFPALDGGRLILELFASKGKSRIPARVVSSVNQIGFLLLILLMLYVTFKDILRLAA